MTFATDEELLKSRKAVSRILEREFRGWSHLLGRDPTDFRMWALSTASEAIGLGLADKKNYDPTRGAVTTWFLMKARRLAQRDIKQAERELKVLHALERQPARPEAEDPFAQLLLADDLFEVLIELSRPQAQALGLIYVVGFSPQEAAGILKRERNAVDALVHRAKAKARDVYRKKFSGRPPQHQQLPPIPADRGSKRRPRSSLGGRDDESEGEGKKQRA